MKVGMSPSRIAQPYTPHQTITIVTINIFSTKNKTSFSFVGVCVCVFYYFSGFFLVLCNWWDTFNHYYYYYSMHVCVIDSIYTYCHVYVTFSLTLSCQSLFAVSWYLHLLTYTIGSSSLSMINLIRWMDFISLLINGWQIIWLSNYLCMYMALSPSFEFHVMRSSNSCIQMND